jgi:hypothetical protein
VQTQESPNALFEFLRYISTKKLRFPRYLHNILANLSPARYRRMHPIEREPHKLRGVNL